jgi:hypothetical protein
LDLDFTATEAHNRAVTKIASGGNMAAEQIPNPTEVHSRDIEIFSPAELHIIGHLLGLPDASTQEECRAALIEYVADGGSTANFRM